MISINTLIVTPFQQNARIVSCPKTSVAVVIDPGGETERIFIELSSQRLVCHAIWLTHSHLDHCGGVKRLKDLTKAKVLAHPAEKFFRSNVKQMCRMFGVAPDELEDCPEPDTYIQGGEELIIGEHQFKVIAAPGHSPGGLCFYCPASNVIFTGDVLFAGSIGRTDLPGGDYNALMRSIEELMHGLPPDTRVLPGHGPETTLEKERMHNPFLRGGFV